MQRRRFQMSCGSKEHGGGQRANLLYTVDGIEAMLEALSVFNHVNILAVNDTFGTGATPPPTFGQPALAGDPGRFK